MPYSKYSSDRAPGWEHIPLYPKGFIAIRTAQLVIALVIAGVSAYAVYILALDQIIFILEVAVATLVISTYHLIARFSTPKAYNYWAIIALDIFLVVFWLASFGVLASQILWISLDSGSSVYEDPYYNEYSYEPLPTSVSSRRSSSSGSDYDDWFGILRRSVYTDVDILMLPICAIAATALGAMEFILHIISLTIHSVFLHRHRAAGLHSKPVNSSSSSSDSGTALVPPSVTTRNKKRPFQLDSTPVPVPHIQIQNHNNRTQQPQVPFPAPAYTPASATQSYLKQQPYLSPEQPQNQNHQQPHQQNMNQQRQYQPYQPFQTHGQGKELIHSPISPQSTGGTTYTQFQRSLAVSPVPVPTPLVPSHQGPPVGVYQLP